jgi:hypothetical protein
MNDIFISHSGNDRPWVAMLVNALQAEGYSVCWDKPNLTSENFTQVTEETINNNRCVITVWSSHSINSFWVKAEAQSALDQSCLIPILCQKVTPPSPYASLLTETLQSWKGDKKDLHYQHLLQTIRQYTQPPKVLQGRKYLDNHDDTITDYSTGLMWKKFSEGQRSIACGKGMVRQYTWEYAGNRFRLTSFAGYNDWRLPTVEELRSLIECEHKLAPTFIDNSYGEFSLEKQCNKPTINRDVFPNTSPTRYWTSTTFYNKEAYAWSLHFDSGQDEENLKYYNASVRLVRLEQCLDQGLIKLFNHSSG